MAQWVLQTKAQGTTRGQDYPVVGGNFSIGAGLWAADLVLEDSAPSVGAGCNLVVAGTTRTGTVIASGAPYQQARCRLVGGAAKMSTILDPSDYRGYLACDILSDILSTAGESVGTVSLLDVYLQHWSRVKEPAYRAVQRLLRAAGMDGVVQTSWSDLTWRVGRDGKINIYRDSWPTLNMDEDDLKVLSYLPTENVAQVAPETGELEPGYGLEVFEVVRKVDRVTYTLDGDQFRALCHLRPE